MNQECEVRHENSDLSQIILFDCVQSYFVGIPGLFVMAMYMDYIWHIESRDNHVYFIA